MSPEKFVYWLQGWVEMEQGKKPSLEQWKMVIAHLDTIFHKVTPSMDDLLSESAADMFRMALHDEVADLSPEDNQTSVDDPTSVLEEQTEDLKDVLEELFENGFAPPTRGGRPPQVELDALRPICSTVPDEPFYCAISPLPRNKR